MPKVFVQESEFDFGEVTTSGNCALKYMTIINNSNIDSVLGLDLRPKEGEEKENEEAGPHHADFLGHHAHGKG